MSQIDERLKQAILYSLKVTCLNRPSNPLHYFASKLKEYNQSETPLECESSDPYKTWEPDEEESALINEFQSEGRRYPEYSERIIESINLSESVVPKTVMELNNIKSILRQVFYFQDLLEEQLDSISESMEEKIYINVSLVQRHTESNKFFILSSGKCQMINDNETVKDLGAGDYFGEEFLIRNTTSNFEVIAIDKVTAWVIDRKSYYNIIKETRRFIRSAILLDLRDHPALKEYDDKLRINILDNLETVHFKLISQHKIDKNQVVFSDEISSIPAIYYVYKGEFEVQNSEKTRLRSGSFFGENSWGGEIISIVPSAYMKIEFSLINKLVKERI